MAIIKEIQSISMGAGGSETYNLSGKITPVVDPDEEPESDAFGAALGGAYGDGGYGVGAFGEDEDGLVMSFDPLDYRYVNESYVPISADELRGNASSEDLAAVAVAKRMPVRMKVKMDSRQISKFLAACANAPLMYEVHQIRVNPQADAAAGGLGAYGAGGGYGAGGADGGYGGGVGGAGYGGGYGGGVGGAGYGSSDGGYGGYGGMDEETGPAESYDEVIEIFGIIYIYNPVDKKKLGTEAPAEGEGDEAADEVASLPAANR